MSGKGSATPTSLLVTRRRFGPLFVAQFGGALNDNVLRNALVAMVTFGALSEQVANRAVTVNLILGLFMLPFFLFSASAGRFADTCPDRSAAVRLIKGAEVLTMAVAAVGLALGSVWLLVASVCLAGIQSAFFGPFKYALLPTLLEKRELLGGNALMNASTYVAIVLGIYWGTELGSGSGDGVAVTLVLMVIAVLGLCASLAMPPLPSGSGLSWRGSWSWNFARDIADTLRGSLKVKGVVPLALVISWFWASGAVILTQLPVVVREVTGHDHYSYLLLLLVVCLGVAVGSLTGARLLRGEVTTRHVPLGIAVASLACVYPAMPGAAVDFSPDTLGTVSSFIAQPAHYPLVGALAVISVAMGFYIVPLYATLQVVAPKGERGRMVATNNILNALCTVAGVLLAGFAAGLVEPYSLAVERLFAGMGLLGVAIAAWVRFGLRVGRNEN